MRFEPGGDNSSFAVLSLGVVGDLRPIPELQPPLVEGIHLRWAFALELGFPWYGFYLFRRLTPAGGSGVSVAGQMADLGLVPGSLGSTSLTLPIGTFSSGTVLQLTDEFANSGTVEIDLSGGTNLEFHLAPTTTSTSATVQIGFTDTYPSLGGSSTGPSGLGGPGAETGECASGIGSDTGNGGSDTGSDVVVGDGTSGLGGNPTGGSVTVGGQHGGPGSIGLGSGTVSGTRIAGASCVCVCASKSGPNHSGTSASNVEPILERVVPLGDGTYLATFGYSNSTGEVVTIPIGTDNGFGPGATDRGQPTSFLPGCHSSVFTTVFDGLATTWTLDGQTQTGSSANATPATTEDGILVSIYRSGVCVTTVVVRGAKGEVVTVPIVFESIDEIRITGGPATLVDIVLVPGGTGTGPGTGVGDGWEPVPNFPQPMPMPVYHDDYPCNSGSENETEAKKLAFKRIRYGTSAPFDGEPFHRIHEALVNMVTGGPIDGKAMDFIESVDAAPDASSPDMIAPTWEDQSTLALLLAASVHPAIAQMLGLYWVDDTAVPGKLYDYALVADYDNAGAGDVSIMLSLINDEDYTSSYVYLKAGVRREVPVPLTPPVNPRAYALPLTFVPTEFRGDVAGAVGLRWDVPAVGSDNRLASDASILYHVWRHDYGIVTPTGSTSTSGYKRITENPIAPGLPRTTKPPEISDWPAAGVFLVDGPLVEGWYGYWVNGIDIFGRYSERSAPAHCLAAADDSVRDYGAVHLVDTTPPPAPLALLASLLDPKDPYVLKDAAYNAWRSGTGNSNVIGLRVSWVWTGAQMRRAPDTREFRIYLSPGATLLNSGDVTSWQRRIAVIGINECIHADSVVALRTDLLGSGATVSGSQVTLADGGSLDGVMTYGVELELPTAVGGQTRFFVTSADPATRTVTVEGSPQVSGAVSWKLGIRQRKYEVFLPGTTLSVAPDFTLPGTPSLAAPVAYNVVGVSAADDKTNEYVPKDSVSTGPLANRYGNEGAVGGPATVYRVLRDRPGKATLPTYPGDRLWATRADFHSQSFFSFHFTKSDNLLVHVYRAMDETLFLVDAAKGFAPNRRTADSTDPPVYPPEWNDSRKQAAANQLNALRSKADYSKLGDDALRVLASYASNVSAFACLTGTPIPASADEKGKSDPADYTPQAALGVHHDTLDGRSVSRYFYRSAYVDSATNAGEMGPSTPPVYLPESHLPRTVRITRVTGGEQSITVAWPDQVGVGIQSYRLFRTDNKKAIRNIRHMVEVLPTVLAGSGTSGEVQVVDYDVTPLRDYFYRLVSVSESGVESEASASVSGRATKSRQSSPPQITDVEKLTSPATAFKVSWSVAEDVSVLVQRHALGSTGWYTLGAWISSTSTEFIDSSVESDKIYEYRLCGRDASGMQTNFSNTWSTEGL